MLYLHAGERALVAESCACDDQVRAPQMPEPMTKPTRKALADIIELKICHITAEKDVT